jgi:hypothetical protein
MPQAQVHALSNASTCDEGLRRTAHVCTPFAVLPAARAVLSVTIRIETSTVKATNDAHRRLRVPRPPLGLNLSSRCDVRERNSPSHGAPCRNMVHRVRVILASSESRFHRGWPSLVLARSNPTISPLQAANGHVRCPHLSVSDCASAVDEPQAAPPPTRLLRARARRATPCLPTCVLVVNRGARSLSADEGLLLQEKERMRIPGREFAHGRPRRTQAAKPSWKRDWKERWRACTPTITNAQDRRLQQWKLRPGCNEMSQLRCE